MKRSRHNLFLLECILAVLVFSVAAAVCARLFAQSYMLEQRTKSLNQGMVLAQSAAEAFRACEGDMQALAPILSAQVSGDSLTASYSPEDKDTGIYTLLLTRTQSGHVAYGDISVLYEGDSVFSLQVACSVNTEGGAAP